VVTSTPTRILDGALLSFGTRGYDATSLDTLAGSIGLSKQTILHHFGSKERLLDALLDRSAAELSVALEEALAKAGPGFARVEALVRAVFRLAARRPELLGLLREVSRRSSIGHGCSSKRRWLAAPCVGKTRASCSCPPTRR
jgi:AcrR family transcriptional regulator